MGRLQLVFLDTMGFDKGNAARAVHQKKLENELLHMLLLLPRGAMHPLKDHLMKSSFIKRFVEAHTSPDPADGPEPQLTAFIFKWVPPFDLCWSTTTRSIVCIRRETEGLQPPPRARCGQNVDLRYMQHHSAHVQKMLGDVVQTTRRYACMGPGAYRSSSFTRRLLSSGTSRSFSWST